MSDWLGVASAEHVRRGGALGIAQIGHGRRDELARMRSGDALIYCSAQERLGGVRELRAFTAIWTVTDDEIWQADEGTFRPWRRRVEYLPGTRPVPIASLRGELVLTATPGWGATLRRGLVTLTPHDAARIRDAMMAARHAR